MLLHPILNKLTNLRLKGMARAFAEQLQQPDINDLSFEDRFGLLVDVETTERENSRLQTRLRKAKLKQLACIEDIDYRSSRGLDKTVILSLASCNWIKSHDNTIIIGATGIGKTYLACALAHKACLHGYTAYYSRLSRLLQELSVAKGDGRYTKLLTSLAKVHVLILDDWGLEGLNDDQWHNLLEVLDDRHGEQSTIVTSQLPVKMWHEAIGDNTLADAILDRLIHNSYRLTLNGDSMRKIRASKETSKKNE
jgi:DNA replication protein DnaC